MLDDGIGAFLDLQPLWDSVQLDVGPYRACNGLDTGSLLGRPHRCRELRQVGRAFSRSDQPNADCIYSMVDGRSTRLLTRTSGWNSFTLPSTSSMSVVPPCQQCAAARCLLSGGCLTLAVRHVVDRVLVLESLDHPADEALGSLGRCVDSHQPERALRRSHPFFRVLSVSLSLDGLEQWCWVRWIEVASLGIESGDLNWRRFSFARCFTPRHPWKH